MAATEKGVAPAPLLPDLTLHQLQVFLAVAREGGFRRAGESLLLSEPAISGQIKHLEEAFGVQLFKRSRGRRAVELTEAGNVLLAATNEAIATLERAASQLHALRPESERRVRLTVSSTFGSFFLPHVYEGFRKAHPDIHLDLLIGQRQTLLDGLERSVFDLGVVSEEVASPTLAATPLFTFQVVLVGPPGHRLAKHQTAPFSELASERIIASSTSSAPHRLLARLAAEHGLKLAVQLELASVDTLARAVESGLGIAAMARHSVASYLAAGRLTQLAVAGFPARLDSYLVHTRAPLNPAAQTLRDYLLHFAW
jgi:DNA-binding transcriptional LysR family regulator